MTSATNDGNEYVYEPAQYTEEHHEFFYTDKKSDKVVGSLLVPSRIQYEGGQTSRVGWIDISKRKSIWHLVLF